MTKLLGISGSLRKGSFNTMLVNEAIRCFGPDHYQLADLNLPLYNGDVEAEGMPDSVTKLCDQVLWADAIIISTPEYNKGPSGVLKNALDWVSRPRPAPMVGKPVAILSAAAGGAGGNRAKAAMYLFLIPFLVDLVTDPEVNVGSAMNVFDADGHLTNEAAMKGLQALMDNLKARL